MKKSQSLAFFFKQTLIRRGEKRDFKGGKGAPKARALRLEALENRELLSVNPAEYSAIREAYDQIALPESLDDVNVIELPELTSEALQAALADAAATPVDDLVVVNPELLGETTLSLENATIVVDFDALNRIAGRLQTVGRELDEAAGMLNGLPLTKDAAD